MFFAVLPVHEGAGLGNIGRRGPALRSDRAFMQIIVRDNNVDQALRALKKKLQREGVYREMKLHKSPVTP